MVKLRWNLYMYFAAISKVPKAVDLPNTAIQLAVLDRSLLM